MIVYFMVAQLALKALFDKNTVFFPKRYRKNTVRNTVFFPLKNEDLMIIFALLK